MITTYPVSFRLNKDFYERLKKFAEQRGMTQTGLIRIALEKYMEENK